MIRFAWTRFRTQALVGAGVLAIAGAVLLVTGIQLNHAYYAAVAACKQQGNCAHMFTYTFPSQGYLDADNLLNALTLAVPGLIGMFWGAPLAAREFETGTFRLAWTQGVTRVRWLAAKLAIAGTAAIAAGELFTLMVAWWSSPISKAEPGYTPFISGSFHTGIAPAGYAAFAFALGVTAGLLIRHTLPAMAVTLAIYAAVIIAFPIWVRPHLIAPVQATSTLSLASIANMPGVGAVNGHLSLVPGPAAAPPGALGHLLQPAHHPGRPRLLQRASRALRPAVTGRGPGVQRLHRKPSPPADGELPAREPLLGLPVGRDRDLPRPRPGPRRVQLLADQPQPLHGTKHPAPPHPPAGPGTPKLSVTPHLSWATI
jgi:ABC-type transport system involved in multi-copper enzyme maturation permease subunit